MTAQATTSFREAVEKILAASEAAEESYTLRPDVEKLPLDKPTIELYRESMKGISDLILARLSSGSNKITLNEGIPFSQLMGCISCGYVVFRPGDVTDTCKHCPNGVGADLYITRKEAYFIALCGSILGLWKVWPKFDSDPTLWESDKQKGPQGSLPLLHSLDVPALG